MYRNQFFNAGVAHAVPLWRDQDQRLGAGGLRGERVGHAFLPERQGRAAQVVQGDLVGDLQRLQALAQIAGQAGRLAVGRMAAGHDQDLGQRHGWLLAGFTHAAWSN
nr:hypothetical protein [Stutzerimonas stutzeri]